MTDLLKKYKQLDKSAQRELDDFLDFLIRKKADKKENSKITYQEKLMQISVWSESDIKLLLENQAQFNQWNIEKW